MQLDNLQTPIPRWSAYTDDLFLINNSDIYTNFSYPPLEVGATLG